MHIFLRNRHKQSKEKLDVHCALRLCSLHANFEIQAICRFLRNRVYKKNKFLIFLEKYRKLRGKIRWTLT